MEDDSRLRFLESYPGLAALVVMSAGAGFPLVTSELQVEFVQFLQQRLLDTQAKLEATEKVRSLLQLLMLGADDVCGRRSGKSYALSFHRPEMALMPLTK